jgi:hypothetical protein
MKYVTLLWYVLGMFTKLKKETVSFVMSLRLSTWNNLAPIGRIFIFDV